MDEFFQRLREIQKKERNLSGLSNVEENFYHDVIQYLDGLMEKIGNNPFSFESYLLRDTQRIVAEICERREHKITNSAVMNVQRSYQLFKEIDADRTIPLLRNSTSEERSLYKELYTSLVKHREGINYPISSSVVKKKQQSVSGVTGSSTPEIMEKNEDKFESIDKPETPKIALNDDIYKEFGQEPGKESKNSNIEINPVKSDFQEKKVKNVHKSNIHTDQNVPTEVLVITDELPSIMGVDSNVYGPLLPGDIITMPEQNARILIKKHKGKLIQRYK